MPKKTPDFQTWFKQVAEKYKESNFVLFIFFNMKIGLWMTCHLGDITKLKKKTCDVHPH